MDCMPVDDDYDDDIIVHVCSAEGGPAKSPALSLRGLFSVCFLPMLHGRFKQVMKSILPTQPIYADEQRSRQMKNPAGDIPAPKEPTVVQERTETANKLQQTPAEAHASIASDMPILR